jgi:hypothetical protein
MPNHRIGKPEQPLGNTCLLNHVAKQDEERDGQQYHRTGRIETRRYQEDGI